MLGFQLPLMMKRECGYQCPLSQAFWMAEEPWFIFLPSNQEANLHTLFRKIKQFALLLSMIIGTARFN